MLVILTIAIAILFLSCKSAEDNRQDLKSTQEWEITAGIVKREIRKGMSGAEVAEALGSPNITTRDEKEWETWVYDKIATEASYSESQSSLFLILGRISDRSGAVSTTQRTLTVIITFDPNGKVASYSYHASKF
jgi:outer membrane protein assembly factor BamE (lipoprotein component of BamABCDE complex)